MGSVFSLDLILFLTLIFSNPSDASETRHRICFPARAHSADPEAEYPDAVTRPESEPREQQQQPSTSTTY